MSEGFLRLGVEVGEFSENGVVGQSEIPTEEVDEDPLHVGRCFWVVMFFQTLVWLGESVEAWCGLSKSLKVTISHSRSRGIGQTVTVNVCLHEDRLGKCDLAR